MIERPGNYQLGSIESRMAARAMMERIQTARKKNVILVTIDHIGRDAKEPLPSPRRIPWEGGVTEIIHVAGSSS